MLRAVLIAAALLLTTVHTAAEPTYNGVGGFVVRWSYLEPEPPNDPYDKLTELLAEMIRQGGFGRAVCNVSMAPMCRTLPRAGEN